MSKTAHSIHWGGPPPRAVSTSATFWKVTGWVVAGVSLLSFLPILGHIAAAPLAAATHIVDRFKNGAEANDELKYRAQYYSAQIFKTLGVNAREGRKATVAEFQSAAAMNPELAKIYQAPIKKRNKENGESLAVNTTVGVAGTVFGGVGGTAVHAVAEASKFAKVVSGTVSAAKTMIPLAAATMASGALANALSGEVVDPQEYLEAIQKTVAEAKEKGMDVRQVLTPQMIFQLRVSQDPQFAHKIKNDFKKPFHKMNEAEQTQVMQAYPALANAATSEAYAVAKDILPVQELGAMKPNLNSTANAYAIGTRNSSFADMVTARRAAQVQAPAGGIA